MIPRRLPPFRGPSPLFGDNQSRSLSYTSGVRGPLEPMGSIVRLSCENESEGNMLSSVEEHSEAESDPLGEDKAKVTDSQGAMLAGTVELLARPGESRLMPRPR